jgi:hypothetical protein
MRPGSERASYFWALQQSLPRLRAWPESPKSFFESSKLSNVAQCLPYSAEASGRSEVVAAFRKGGMGETGYQ